MLTIMYFLKRRHNLQLLLIIPLQIIKFLITTNNKTNLREEMVSWDKKKPQFFKCQITKKRQGKKAV